MNFTTIQDNENGQFNMYKRKLLNQKKKKGREKVEAIVLYIAAGPYPTLRKIQILNKIP